MGARGSVDNPLLGSRPDSELLPYLGEGRRHPVVPQLLRPFGLENDRILGSPPNLKDLQASRLWGLASFRNRSRHRGDHVPVQAFLKGELRVELLTVADDDQIQAGDDKEELMTGTRPPERILGSGFPEPGSVR